MSSSIDNISKIVGFAYPAITAVPGVIAINGNNHKSQITGSHAGVLRQYNIFKNIEITETNSFYEIGIKIGLIPGINILDVASEVQIRTCYELDKKLKMDKRFLVNVYVIYV